MGDMAMRLVMRARSVATTTQPRSVARCFSTSLEKRGHAKEEEYFRRREAELMGKLSKMKAEEFDVTEVSSNAMFGGRVVKYRHESNAVGTPMVFSVFLPPAALTGAGAKVPVIYWLSGLTCTDDNFTHKAGAQQFAAEHGVAIVAPDTSPR